jgi:glycosyltransferase involved in cell wall biosynthesis
MPDRPRLSVVTPSFEQGRFIGDAIRSVLAQGHDEVEHIIVDAESRDETPEVLAGFEHLRVICEPDDGQSDALNKGFAAARGEFVAWLNADDYFLPGAFDHFFAMQARHPNAGAFFGHFYHVDAAGQFLRSMRVAPFDAGVCRHYGVCQPTSGSFFRGHVFRELAIVLDLGLHIVMDWDFYQQLAAAEVEMLLIPEFLTAFRLHEDNKSIGQCDPHIERRATLDARRVAERMMFHQRYGIHSALGPAVDEALRRGLFHLHHGRHIGSKAARLYYLSNALDRWTGRVPDVSPPG